ncbi:MAG: response regulator, partial [Syntrophales bacterium]|nr:response regulator [Syntrophales bacterium]
MYKNPVRKNDEKAEELVVVDDQPQMRDIIRGMLRNNRFSGVNCFESAKQALRSISLNPVPIDLIITDWHMPNMT